MGKKEFVIIIFLVGVSILLGCGDNYKNNSIDQSTIIVQPVVKQETLHKEEKSVTESNTEIVVNSNEVAEELQDIESLQQNFSEEESRIFNLIKETYQEFEYSDVYVNTSENHKKMVFSKNENGLYFGCYISYDVFCYEGGMITFFFDAGTAYRGFGYYLVVDDSTVIKVEKSIGTETYEYGMYKNGIKIDGESKRYN